MANALTPPKMAAMLTKIVHQAQDKDISQDIQYQVYSVLLDNLLQASAASTNNTRIAEQVNAVLNQVDFQQVFSQYMKESKDPAVYFFEEFTRACDRTASKKRGVHYSPPAVVSYMVRGVESILSGIFGMTMQDAVVIDPCCGMGTFLKYIEDNCDHGKLIGLELMPTPAKLASRILKKSEIRQINSLDETDLGVGNKMPVIIGNPPYSGHSSNAGKIDDLLSDYKNGLNERNYKWLQDDYVKFIRMAQQHIDSAGAGIVAFITNHSYIFNPTFRVMRESLMRTFDSIYVLDLNGNAKINAISSDENVFPIQMGVAISFMLKNAGCTHKHIYYAPLHGTRRQKLDTLANMSFTQTPWEDITPLKPFNLFIPVDNALQEAYCSYPSILDLFKKGSVGFVTSRDAFAVDKDKQALLDRIAALRDGNIAPEEIHNHYAVGDLDIEAARHILRNDANWESRIVEAVYRPFDRRWVYLSKAVMERPRLPFMENMLHDNIALAVGRAGRVTGSNEWDVVFCADCPADLNLFRRGGAMFFPKYIYTDGHKSSNLKSDPDGLFFYIYAILHSAQYRKRYADFLRSDYPRIPITRDSRVFDALVDLAKELIAVHLMPNKVFPGEMSQMTIGGYNIPLGSAVIRTNVIREKIDEVIIANPLW
ncbi:MAG: type ISP restriction/modification enzyme [Armatimonadota bacterium]